MIDDNSASYLTKNSLNFNHEIFQSGDLITKKHIVDSTEFMKTMNDTNSISVKGNGRNSAISRFRATSNQLNAINSQDLRSKNDTV